MASGTGLWEVKRGVGVSGELSHFFIKISVNAVVLVVLLIFYVGVPIAQINSVLTSSLIATVIATVVTWIVFLKFGGNGLLRGVLHWLFNIALTAVVLWIILSRLMQLPNATAALISTFLASAISFFAASALLVSNRGY